MCAWLACLVCFFVSVSFCRVSCYVFLFDVQLCFVCCVCAWLACLVCFFVSVSFCRVSCYVFLFDVQLCFVCCVFMLLEGTVGACSNSRFTDTK